MEVDTNELLRRIGMVLRVISNKMDRLIEIGERVEGQVRLPSEEEAQTVGDVLMDDACIPSDAVPDEPPKKWRILEPGEVVQEGDWMNAMINPQEDGPPDGGWLAAPSFYFGKEASFYFRLHFARPVATEPAKEPEPEHPAGPKPDPGEGYRILKKNPPEDLQPGDEYEPVASNGDWVESENAHTNRKQGPRIWYRRKIETPKPPEPEYREPVLPGDSGKVCEFSDDNENWHRRKLAYWIKSEYGFVWWSESGDLYKYARIRKDA